MLSLRWLGLVAAAGLLSCGPAPTDDQGGDTDDTIAGDQQTTGTETDTDTDVEESAFAITGTIQGGQSTKPGPHSSASSTFLVLAQSAETLETYAATASGGDDFSIALPDAEKGNTFTVTLLDGDGRPLGPVLLSSSGSEGVTGLAMTQAASLGDVVVPSDPAHAPLLAAGDASAQDLAAKDVTVRLTPEGVPVGVGSVGKGAAAVGAVSSDPRHAGDGDRDGLIDVVDADDDGDGILDDFDSETTQTLAQRLGLQLNLFMNLKVEGIIASKYLSGDAGVINQSLKSDTVITFEVRGDASLAKTIAGVRVLGPPAPSPSYLPLAKVLGSSTKWSEDDYALGAVASNHFQQFVIPYDTLSAGDAFTFEVTFSDGSVRQFLRMINFVFKGIPDLEKVGAPGSLSAYSSGTVLFDGTKNLVLEWRPPADDTGAPLTDLDYRFEVFYYDTNGQQISGIDGDATWPPPAPVSFDTTTRSYGVFGSVLSAAALSADGTFSVTLPKEIFKDTVVTSGGNVAVQSYKVDIAAQKNGNNSALMVLFHKL